MSADMMIVCSVCQKRVPQWEVIHSDLDEGVTIIAYCHGGRDKMFVPYRDIAKWSRDERDQAERFASGDTVGWAFKGQSALKLEAS